MESNQGNRTRKRFIRSELDEGITLTERDLAILSELVEQRFMSARHFQALYGARVFRRLHILFHHGYVDRPLAQRAWRLREGGGSKPIVYALANRGARALADAGVIGQGRRDWNERNRNLARLSLTIPHELMIADVRVAFRLACVARGLRFVRADELAQGQKARALSVPGRERPLYPDLIFAVVRDDAEPSLFFVEVDRDTEPNVRHGSDAQQSLRRKYEAYLSYARAKLSLEQFGVVGFRVLTMTTGEERKIANVVQTAHEVCGGVGVGRFLVMSITALEASDPLELSWFDASGKEVRLGV